MNVLIDCPQSRAGEWRFRLFGTPVGVKIWFWIAVVLMCSAQETATVLIWIAACLGSILIHEFGHVYAFRSLGDDAEVVLYGWGGLTIPRRGVRGLSPELFVALAGPAAGFAATILTSGLVVITGASLRIEWPGQFPILNALPTASSLISDYRWFALLNDLLWINLYWGLVNLLPVYPFDGWHAANAVLTNRDPGGGKRTALICSAITAGLMVVLGLTLRNLYMVVIFAVLAASSAQAVESARRSPRSQGRWRG